MNPCLKFHLNGVHLSMKSGKSWKIMRKKIWFSRVFKSCSSGHIITYKVCRSILGVQRTHFRPNFTFPAGSGRIIDRIIKIQKSQKITIFVQKIDFFLRVYIDLYDGIWAEIGLQRCLKCFLSKIRYLHYFWTTFGKIEKIDFF